MSENKQKQQSIGALWIKANEKGQFFTGQLELNGKKISIVVFPNKFKEESKHPDFKIFESNKQAPASTTKTVNPVKKSTPQPEPDLVDPEDDPLF